MAPLSYLIGRALVRLPFVALPNLVAGEEVARELISLWLLLFVTPLLLPLRGVLAGRDKALIWGTLVSLLYLVHGGMTAWAEPAQRWLGLLELVLSLTYLISASLFVRWRAEAQQAA